jgi:4-hydroxy-tetrahydrodipicolinate synthase
LSTLKIKRLFYNLFILNISLCVRCKTISNKKMKMKFVTCCHVKRNNNIILRMANAMNFPSGAYTVLVTPFLTTGSIDYCSIDKWLNYQNSSNVTGLVILGTTSESPTLSRSEQLDIVTHVKAKMVEDSMTKFLCVGVGGNNTMETLEFAKQCEGLCDGIMVTVPHYNKPTQNGIIAHYQHICEGVKNVPVMMYNIPSRCGVNALPETIQTICDNCANVVAIKEASGSIDQIIEITRRCPELKIFSGDDKLVLDVMLHGGCGVISVASNIVPIYVSNLVHMCMEGRYGDARNEFYDKYFDEFCGALFCETNPTPIKYLLYEYDVFETECMRLPMLPLSENKRQMVTNAYVKLMKEIAKNPITC